MKTSAQFVGAGLLLWLLTASAAASELPRFSIAPFGGFVFAGEFSDGQTSRTVSPDDAAIAGLLFNFRQTANTQWEVYYSRQQNDVDAANLGAGQAAVELDVQIVQVGGTYVASGGRARPFLAATLGGTHFDPDPLSFDSETFFSFGLGGGWMIGAHERLDLRLEVRATGTLVDSDTQLFCQTGPDSNICAITADSDIYWQLQTLLGFVIRF